MSPICYFATDLHGHFGRYEKLFAAIIEERPAAVFLGGDLLPGIGTAGGGQFNSFLRDFLFPSFARIQGNLDRDYPAVMLILGNDDPRSEEPDILDGEARRLWHYVHGRPVAFQEFCVCGCAYVPPTPFALKDWERYDVSRYVDPGCISPEEGYRSVPVRSHDIRWGTIRGYLDELAKSVCMGRSIFLFHAPPHGTPLDRAFLDGKTYDHVALDVHVGSIAIRQFIEQRQPLLTLHGHVHESARLTGEWKMRIGRTVCINAAHDGPELALVQFDPDRPEEASRRLL